MPLLFLQQSSRRSYLALGSFRGTSVFNLALISSLLIKTYAFWV